MCALVSLNVLGKTQHSHWLRGSCGRVMQECGGEIRSGVLVNIDIYGFHYSTIDNLNVTMDIYGCHPRYWCHCMYIYV